MENSGSSADNTDFDESFEDAQDSSPAQKRTHSNDNTRSLTGRPPSTNSNHAAEEGDLDSKDSEPNPKTNGRHQEDDETGAAGEGTDTKATKSPLLTAHRLSTTSMDDVNLSGARSESTPASPPALPEKDIPPVESVSAKPLPQPSRFANFSAALPSVPWSQPVTTTKSINSNTPQPPTNQRKTTGPFSWLGRATSTPKDLKSPPLSASTNMGRRNTSASISTIGSNPELMLKTLDAGQDANGGATGRPPQRTTLRDRFKMLRMREEAGIVPLEEESDTQDGGGIAGLVGRTANLGLGIGSPSSTADEKEGGPAGSPLASDPPTLKRSFTIDPTLAPGTVSGPASSPMTPIDWDFWQSVVNEGPQAVARTSPEELTQAFIGGIPQTIRGVIWQVLANSKNDDLEGVYKDLVARGTDKEVRDSLSSASPAMSMIGNGKIERESVNSSSSSIHSEHSTQATSANVGLSSPSPSQERDPETLAKIQAAIIAERKQKTQEDAAALKKLEKMIKRDMGSRTSYSKYTTAAGLQEPLFNVCKAYALFDEGVGYPQGMNFIIMPLLFNMSEEEAFCLLVRLMNKYGVRELFIQDMPGLHLHLYQFERLLEDVEPALYCHLNRRGVPPKLYATQWFLTLFAYRFPLQLVMRVYDLILSEGLEGAILKFGMAVIQRNVQTLLGMNDMLALTNFLKEKIFDVYIDQTPSSKSLLESGFFGNSGGTDSEVYRADLLVQDAAAVKLTPDMLTKYRVEWEEKVRSEKERESELENLRTTVASQAIRIRQLEERTEKSDTEHVQLASELVRLKVENEELHDRNEALQVQTEELKKVAESEANNVEERLRGEMDRVTQRNNEVQSDNRKLEDLMAQMEKELMETKMKHAEISEDHETLKQKWNDLRKALD